MPIARGDCTCRIRGDRERGLRAGESIAGVAKAVVGARGFRAIALRTPPRASQGRAAAEPVPEKPAVWGQVANAVVYGVPSTLKNCVVRLWWGESAVCSLSRQS